MRATVQIISQHVTDWPFRSVVIYLWSMYAASGVDGINRYEMWSKFCDDWMKGGTFFIFSGVIGVEPSGH